MVGTRAWVGHDDRARSLKVARPPLRLGPAVSVRIVLDVAGCSAKPCASAKSSRHSRRKTWQPEFGTARQQSGSHRSIRQCGPTRLAEIYTVCRRSRHLSGPWGGTPLAPPTRRSWQTSAARHNRCFGLGKRHGASSEGTIEGLRALSRQLISELSSKGLLRKPQLRPSLRGLGTSRLATQ
jgi:hypothetical protein